MSEKRLESSKLGLVGLNNIYFENIPKLNLYNRFYIICLYYFIKNIVMGGY